MAKFIYKMQNILNLKYKLEDQAKIEFGLATARLAMEEKKLEDIKVRRRGYETQLKNSVSGNSGPRVPKLDIMKIKQLEQAVEILKVKIRIQTYAVKDASLHVEKARKKLKEAMIERKTHEKMREKAFEEFKIEVNKEEKKEVDELVSYQYGVKSKEVQ